MEDDAYTCPNCGATNAHLKRTAPQTPKTIAELEDWYRARHLPPYETTRFFIGIDTKEPKAFGIYQKGSSFIVYKNKADGSRAIRYSGNDEAYAVNELYLRLKEEILNQKNHSQGSQGGSSSGSQPMGKGCLGMLGRFFLCMLAAIAFFTVLGLVGSKIDSLRPKQYSYYEVDGRAYYYYGYTYGRNAYEWWDFDESAGDWELYTYVADKKTFPKGIGHKNVCDSILELADRIGYPYESYTQLIDDSPLYIYNSHKYKDLHHETPASNTYYYCNGESYYYLDDQYGARYGKKDNTGWYHYDSDNGWEYYCNDDNRYKLGDDLWYDSDDYAVGKSYSDYTSGDVYYFDGGSTWNSGLMASDFGNTVWYSEYEAANTAYNEYQRELESSRSSSSSSSWSSDSDWDWDSGSDSWDSGSTDWDSDW